MPKQNLSDIFGNVTPHARGLTPDPRTIAYEQEDSPQLNTQSAQRVPITLEGEVLGSTDEEIEEYFRPQPKANPLPHAFRKFGDFSRFTTQGQIIEVLAQHIPQNDYNFPNFIYRPDFLPFDRIKQLMDQVEANPQEVGAALEDILRASIMELRSDEGFPTDMEGQPVWNKQTFETSDDYLMFLSYLDLGGQRAIHKVISWPPEVVNETSKVNYWAMRAHAYDMYRIAYHERQKLSRILDMEDSHYNIAHSAISKISGYLANLTMEDLKEMGVKGAIDSLEKLTKIQRASVGLDGGGGKSSSDILSTPSMQKIMQKLTANQVKEEKQLQPTEILTDLDDLEKAQDLILRIQDSRNGVGDE